MTMEFTKNLKKLIDEYGVENVTDIIEIMLTQEIKTIEELNDCFVDELSYLAENA